MVLINCGRNLLRSTTHVLKNRMQAYASAGPVYIIIDYLILLIDNLYYVAYSIVLLIVFHYCKSLNNSVQNLNSTKIG